MSFNDMTAGLAAIREAANRLNVQGAQNAALVVQIHNTCCDLIDAVARSAKEEEHGA